MTVFSFNSIVLDSKETSSASFMPHGGHTLTCLAIGIHDDVRHYHSGGEELHIRCRSWLRAPWLHAISASVRRWYKALESYDVAYENMQHVPSILRFLRVNHGVGHLERVMMTVDRKVRRVLLRCHGFGEGCAENAVEDGCSRLDRRTGSSHNTKYFI